MTTVDTLIDDLRAESAELDAIVAGLEPEGWELPTPAPGWTIAHQIAHLAWTDRLAALAARDPEGFQAQVAIAVANPGGFVDAAAAEGIVDGPGPLLQRWRQDREDVATALAEAPADAKLPWLGPPMKAPSLVTARLMETWAHGQDIADTLSVTRKPTDRLRHVAHIGVRARGFAFTVNGLPVPDEPVRVELLAPSGEHHTWGPETAADRVTGPLLDFCLLVTQRRHAADLDLTASGPVATRWLDIAQAFAGPPGAGREPGQFS